VTAAVLADPQLDVDRLIERVRENRLQAKALARCTFIEYARGARTTAIRRHFAGDEFGETLTTARAVVYEAAAELLREKSLAEAAAEMMRRALAAQVRTAPWINYDAAGVSYVTARAWQFCAWKIDPSLPEVQPRWP
jgi:preprotein translocase subunit SecA